MSRKPLLEASGITVNRNGGAVLCSTSVKLHQEEIVGVYGPNGAGKSTLLLALAGLIPIASGFIEIDGLRLGSEILTRTYHRRVTAVFQEPLLLRGTVEFNVRLGLLLRGIKKLEAATRAALWLDRLGIAHLADRSIYKLSGGEAQRVSLARAFALDPEVVFLDEPFSALDQLTRQRMVQELANILRSLRCAAIFVTHDIAEATALCDRCLIIDNGTVLQEGPLATIRSFPDSLRVAEIAGSDLTL